MQLLIEELIGERIPVEELVDNDQATTAVNTGYNKKLRSLPRTQRVAIGVLNDCLQNPSMKYSIKQCPSVDNKGDMFTKAREL